MRFLECEPNLHNDPDYEEEAEVFYDNPGRWLQREYGGKTQQPDYVVFFDVLEQVGLVVQCLCLYNKVNTGIRFAVEKSVFTLYSTM